MAVEYLSKGKGFAFGRNKAVAAAEKPKSKPSPPKHMPETPVVAAHDAPDAKTSDAKGSFWNRHVELDSVSTK